jgi:hypothetical protein
MILTIQQLEKLLETAKRKEADCVIVDWMNEHIRVLSKTKTNKEIVLSSGPMQYQDILLEISER